jgi:hypothetical protein
MILANLRYHPLLLESTGAHHGKNTSRETDPLWRNAKCTKNAKCIYKPFKVPRNRFSAWRDGATTLFVVPARQGNKAGGIDFSESIPGLHKRSQIRAQNTIQFAELGIFPGSDN